MPSDPFRSHSPILSASYPPSPKRLEPAGHLRRIPFVLRRPSFVHIAHTPGRGHRTSPPALRDYTTSLNKPCRTHLSSRRLVSLVPVPVLYQPIAQPVFEVSMRTATAGQVPPSRPEDVAGQGTWPHCS